LFAHFYTKVYDHILRPLMEPDRPNAAPELAAAIDTLDRITSPKRASPPSPDLTHALLNGTADQSGSTAKSWH